MTTDEITTAETRLAELNAQNDTLRREKERIQTDLDEARQLVSDLEKQLAANLAARKAVKDEYGALYEDVGIAKKEAARLAQQQAAEAAATPA
jgi:chromosome segregation ATPase